MRETHPLAMVKVCSIEFQVQGLWQDRTLSQGVHDYQEAPGWLPTSRSAKGTQKPMRMKWEPLSHAHQR